MPITKEMLEKRAAMVRTGGKGTVRRTVRGSAPKAATNQNTNNVTKVKKQLGVSPVADVAEATMFKADGSVMIFNQPKVEASMQSQCFTITGKYETRDMKEMMAGLQQ